MANQGGILQKLQQLPEKLRKAFLTLFAQWAQQNGLNIQELQLNPQALEEAMTAFVQAIQGGQLAASQPVTAKLGAKLNYIRDIKGACPEGQELVYFKQGGRVCKKCIEAAAGGEKVKDGKKEIADFKKKKACKGMKTRKKQDGGELGYNFNTYKPDAKAGPDGSFFEEPGRPSDLFIPKPMNKLGGELKSTKKACVGIKAKFQPGGKTLKPKETEKPKYTKDQLAGRAPVKVVNGVKYFLNGDGQVVKDPKGKNSGSWTLKDDDKMLKYRLKGTKNPSEKNDSILNQMKWNNLPESEKKKHEVQELKCGGKTKKHQQGGVIGFFQPGGLVKRFSVSTTGKNGTTRYFDTEEEAKAYQRTLPSGSSVRRDGGKEYQGQVLKVDRTKEASTAYARQKAEAPYNKLSFKEAYNLARKNGVRWFAYKGKVYKSDLEGKAAKNNLTEMQAVYGNNLGWSGDPKMKTKASQRARAQYRKEINTSEKGYTKEVKKSKAPYVSSYDGGELFANFMGLASPTRWIGAVGRASRGEGNTGTFVGKVLNNMLDPQNGARENQGIFSSGLSPADEQWAAEHPVISGVTNGALDAMAFGFRPRIDKATKLKPNYGYVGRKFATTKETVPMGIYEGDLNISPGTAIGRNPYVELGKQVGLTTKTVTKKKMIEPGTRYVKSVSEVPTGDYNFSWDEGMKDMYPWVVANTFNRTMK